MASSGQLPSGWPAFLPRQVCCSLRRTLPVFVKVSVAGNRMECVRGEPLSAHPYSGASLRHRQHGDQIGCDHSFPDSSTVPEPKRPSCGHLFWSAPRTPLFSHRAGIGLRSTGAGYQNGRHRLGSIRNVQHEDVMACLLRRAIGRDHATRYTRWVSGIEVALRTPHLSLIAWQSIVG